MDITPLVRPGLKLVEGYGPGRFRIAGEIFTTPVLVFPEEVHLWDATIPLKFEDFSLFLDRAETVEFLILGTGTQAVRPSLQIRKTLEESGVVLESMDTGAACRTFNVLLSEGRQVASALMPVSS